MRFHFHKKWGNNRSINKPNIPIILVFNTSSKVTICCNLMNNFVLSIQYVNNKLTPSCIIRCAVVILTICSFILFSRSLQWRNCWKYRLTISCITLFRILLFVIRAFANVVWTVTISMRKLICVICNASVNSKLWFLWTELFCLL